MSAQPSEAIERTTANLAIYNQDPERNPHAFAMMIPQVRREELVHLRREQPELRGFPTAYAYEWHPQPKLLFFPKPDKEYTAQLRYCPALKVI